MSREDFLDAPPTPLDDDPGTAAPPRRARRRLHGGWALMVAAGLIAAVANYALLTGGDPGTRVAVLTADAPVGTPVGDLQIEMRAVPLPDPGAHLLADQRVLDSLEGQVTAAALPAGVLLRATDLRVPGGEGEGAMSLPVDASRSVGGLLQPGDVVDVIAGEEAAALVARDLQVIAVGDAGGGALGSVGGSSITVSVDADQALALAQALREGPIDLVRTARADGGGR